MQMYLQFSEREYLRPKVKGSANRMKNQIYLDFSEVQPTFDEVRGTNK